MPSKKISDYVRFAINDRSGVVVCAPAIKFLRSIPDKHADLVFLDPPFNLGKDYGNGTKADRLPRTDYLNWLSDVITESCRILSDGGALYLYHLPEIATRLVQILNEKLQFRHWIAISMKNTFVRGHRLYPAHYALLYYTKGNPKSFTRPRLKPQRCRNCGNFVKDYGGYRKIIEEKGVNLSDIWDDLSPVRHNSTKKRAANELPNLLFERVVEISGYPNDTYVDPFAGSGTGPIAAIKADMNFIVADISQEYCELVETRVSEYIKGVV